MLTGYLSRKSENELDELYSCFALELYNLDDIFDFTIELSGLLCYISIQGSWSSSEILICDLGLDLI